MSRLTAALRSARRGARPRGMTDAATVDAADTVLRLAVLLQAGIPPARSWELLAESGNPAALRVAAATGGRASLADAVSLAGGYDGAPDDGRDPWRDVAAAWRVATAVGAPLADSLRGIAAALRDAHEARDDVRVALAEPAGTARLMSWLPLVAIVLGFALGFDTLGVLVGSPAGLVCLATGALLVLAAHRWTGALVRRARADAGVPGLAGDVLAIALSAGVSVERATALVVDASGEEPDAAARGILSLSRRAGVPAAELLRATASLERHRARTAARLRAARLSTHLLVPLGVCTLPAFLLLGVAPMLLGILGAVPLSL